MEIISGVFLILSAILVVVAAIMKRFNTLFPYAALAIAFSTATQAVQLHDYIRGIGAAITFVSSIYTVIYNIRKHHPTVTE